MHGEHLGPKANQWAQSRKSESCQIRIRNRQGLDQEGPIGHGKGLGFYIDSKEKTSEGLSWGQ